MGTRRSTHAAAPRGGARLARGVGYAGCALFGFNAWMLLRVLRGPGDDNPVGYLFAWAALGALLPALGVLRPRGAGPLRWPAMLWLLPSLVVLVLGAAIDVLLVRTALSAPLLLALAGVLVLSLVRPSWGQPSA